MGGPEQGGFGAKALVVGHWHAADRRKKGGHMRGDYHIHKHVYIHIYIYINTLYIYLYRCQPYLEI